MIFLKKLKKKYLYKRVFLDLGKEFWCWTKKQASKKTATDSEEYPLLGPLLFPIGLFLLILSVSLSLYGVMTFFFPKETEPESQVGGAFQSVKDVCKPFEFSDWQTGQGILIYEDEHWVLGEDVPNGMIRYDHSIKLNSQIKLKFLPQSEKAVNFVLHVHDLYELVIGDGSYQGVTLKAYTAKGQPMEIIADTEKDRRNIFESGGLEKGKEVTLVLNQNISQLTDGSYEVLIRISHKPDINSEEEKVFATYDFLLPPDFNLKERQDDGLRVSMGLIAAVDDSKVAVDFMCFEVSE